MGILEKAIYDSKIREIGHHTRECDGKRFIIINQTHWYEADEWTDETAIEDYKKKYLSMQIKIEKRGETNGKNG